MSLDLGPNPRAWNTPASFVADLAAEPFPPGGRFDQAAHDRRYGTTYGLGQGTNAHPLVHSAGIQQDALNALIAAGLPDAVKAAGPPGFGTGPLSLTDWMDLFVFLAPNGRPWLEAISQAARAAAPGGAEPAPGGQAPGHSPDEPYESEHTISATITDPLQLYVKKSVYSLENHRTGVNEWVAEMQRLGAPVDLATMEAGKQFALALWHGRLQAALRDVTPDPENPVGSYQSYFLGLSAAQRGLEQGAVDAADRILLDAHLKFFTARFPLTLEGFDAYRRMRAYKVVWKARRSLSEAVSIAMLTGALDPWTDWKDQDPIRHLVIGTGSGGLNIR